MLRLIKRPLRSIGNFHAERQPIERQAHVKKFGLERRARKYRTRRKYLRPKRSQIQKTPDGELLAQASKMPIPSGDTDQRVDNIRFNNNLAMVLYRYYASKNKTKTPEEIIEMMTNPTGASEDLENAFEGVNPAVGRQNLLMAGLNSETVDVSRPMPSGFGALSATDIICNFENELEDSLEYLETTPGLQGYFCKINLKIHLKQENLNSRRIILAINIIPEKKTQNLRCKKALVSIKKIEKKCDFRLYHFIKYPLYLAEKFYTAATKKTLWVEKSLLKQPS